MTTPHTEAPDRLAELDAENLALHRKLAGETLRADQGWERYEAANRRANAAEAALAKAQEDARRYRWLRRNVSAHGVIDGWAFGFPTHLSLPAPEKAMRDPASGLDAAIDAALRETAQPADHPKGEAC